MPALAGHSIVLGTMRIHEKGRSEAEWAAIFGAAWDRGVRRLHSSSEYDSFPMLRAVLDRLARERPDVEFAHVVKLADPHFGEDRFDGERFATRVLEHCDALGVPRIETVQWMWRAGIEEDERRIAAFEADRGAIQEAARQLREAGTMGELGCFPYSPAFAAAAVRSGLFDGLIVYANAFEREYEPEIAAARAAGMFVDIIRPFAAGKALRESGEPADRHLVGLLERTGARAAILSVSGPEQLDAVLPPL